MFSWFSSSGKNAKTALVEDDQIPLTSQVGGDSEDEEIFNGSTPSITLRLHHDDDQENGVTRDGRVRTKVVTHRMSWKQKFCFCGVIGIAIGVVFLIYLGLPCPDCRRSWSTEFPRFITESAVRLYDVNEDGIIDMIFGADVEGTQLSPERMAALCKEFNLDPPCGGRVMILDGRNGELMKTIVTPHEIFELNCGNVDLNGDGIKECLATGRIGGMSAIDLKEGRVLWQIEESNIDKHFNIYQPQDVPDLNFDGVPDFVITHGGDVRFDSKERNRPAGRIMLISGHDGKSLGTHLEMPDGRETYSSPVLYKRPDGAIYIFFGSGGETIKGSLWAISLLDLYIHTVKQKEGARAPSLPGIYTNPWGKHKKDKNGFIEIFSAKTEMGVMVPVVVADMDGDEVDDIIVSVFDGTIEVLNGATLQPIWTTGTRFQGYQFYSIPALGYFNDDDTLDLMVHLNLGVWEKYNLTIHTILDGKTGEILWNLKSSKYTMSSPLVLQTGYHKDVFVFWVQGREGHIIDREITKRTSRHGDDNSDQAKENDDDDDDDDDDDRDEHLKSCEKQNDFTGEVFLLDRDYSKTPIKLLEAESTKIKYNILYSNIMPGIKKYDNVEELSTEEMTSVKDERLQRVKSLPAPKKKIIQDTMKGIPEEEINQLQQYVQDLYKDLKMSKDDVHYMMMYYIMDHVLMMMSDSYDDGPPEQPFESVSVEPDHDAVMRPHTEKPQKLPKEKSHKAHKPKQTIKKPVTKHPTTMKPTTIKPTTMKPSTKKPSTMKPTTMKPSTIKPTTKKPTTIKPTTVKPSTKEPSTTKPTTMKPLTQKQTTIMPTVPPQEIQARSKEEEKTELIVKLTSRSLKEVQTTSHENSQAQKVTPMPDLKNLHKRPNIPTPRMNFKKNPNVPAGDKHEINAVVTGATQSHIVTTPKPKKVPARPPPGHRNQSHKNQHNQQSRKRRHGDMDEGNTTDADEVKKTVVLTSDGELCVTESVVVRPTGAIGEIRGQLYYFGLVGFATMYYDITGGYVGAVNGYKTVAHKVSLSDMIKSGEKIALKEEYFSISKDVKVGETNTTEPEEHFTFLPIELQTWLGYMGTRGDGHYKIPHK